MSFGPQIKIEYVHPKAVNGVIKNRTFTFKEMLIALFLGLILGFYIGFFPD